MPHLIQKTQLYDIQAQLEAVTGQYFKCFCVDNTETDFLCAWRNETRIGYVLALHRQNYRTFTVSMGIERGHEIETRYSKSLDQLECQRLLGNPRECVLLFTGQKTEKGYGI